MSAQCLSEYGLRDAFESDTMRVPVERLYCGGKKSVKKVGEVLDREVRKVVNY